MVYAERMGRELAIRPSDLDQVIDKFFDGMTWDEALRLSGIMPRTFYRKVTLDDELRREYAWAQEIKADLMIEDAIKIADSDVNPFKARNQIDIRKYAASKYHSKKFGDKLDVTVENLDLRGVLLDAKNRSRFVTQVVETKQLIQRAATDYQSVDRPNLSADEAALAKMLS